MKTRIAILIALASLTFSAPAVTPPGWMEDFEKAKEKAKAEKKLLLLDFTGSDWCPWCIKLDNEVFKKSDFKNYAKENLVLVELDFPNSKPQTKKVKDQNAKLKNEFKASGFPTIVVLNADGKEIARWTGYSKNFFEELKAKVDAAKK